MSTEDRDTRMIADYAVGVPVAEIVARHGVTHPILYKALRRRGQGPSRVRNRKRLWTADEDALILARESPDASIAHLIGRTEMAIRSRRYLLATREAHRD